MRKLVFWIVPCLMAIPLAFPAGAQEGGAPLDEAEMATEAAPAGVTVTPVDVWWGNRSISYGNYIKFDWIDSNCPGACKYCDKNHIDCETGCKCPECEFYCDDCDNCPPNQWDKIFFDLDRSHLRPDALIECRKILEYLQKNPAKGAVIEGHCCDLASDPYNIALGQRRADSVKRWLVDQGIDPARLHTATYGERQPWVGTEKRELNRRAIVTATP